MSDRPNLFAFATSELSQDAVLCWLAAWSTPGAEAHDPELAALGRAFLSKMLDRAGRTLPEDVTNVRVRRQYLNIDVLIEIEAASLSSPLVICLEDKTGTVEHSEQLARYRERLLEVGRRDVIGIYVQTGDQSSYDAVRAAGYFPLGRAELIQVLEGCAHPIVTDFREYLQAIEDDFCSFRTSSPDRWSGRAWEGFFSVVQNELGGGDWRNVPNPSGGFHAFYWGGTKIEGGDLYLQLSEGRLALRITVLDADRRRELRDFWMHRAIAAAEGFGLVVQRPKRRGSGRTMALAELCADYRVTESGETVDIEATIARLRRAEKWLMETVSAHVR